MNDDIDYDAILDRIRSGTTTSDDAGAIMAAWRKSSEICRDNAMELAATRHRLRWVEKHNEELSVWHRSIMNELDVIHQVVTRSDNLLYGYVYGANLVSAVTLVVVVAILVMSILGE